MVQAPESDVGEANNDTNSTGCAPVCGSAVTSDATITLKSSLADELPVSFREYLKRHGIPLGIYDAVCPRYVRVMGRHCGDVEVAAALTQAAAQPVSWLPAGWWELPPEMNLSRCPAYKKGALFGMDAASAAAVLALSVEPGHDVLDLCCAPGAKLVYLAELLRSCGRLVGVDAADHRLAACRTLCRKYGVEDVVSLFHADGRTWSLRCWDLVERLRVAERDGHGRKGRKRRRESLLAAEKSVAGLGLCSAANNLAFFDRVLVDAECTHDGSVKHVEKYRSQWGGLDEMDRRVPWLQPAQLEQLVELQRSLLWNGWQQLRPGGILVYSTCSLAPVQNEEVVQWLLEREPLLAHLDPLPFELSSSATPAMPCPNLQPHLQKTADEQASTNVAAARFDPVTSRTSGLFLARLRKAAVLGPVSDPAAATSASITDPEAGTDVLPPV